MNKTISFLVLMSALTTPSIAQQPCDASCQEFIQKCKDATNYLNNIFKNPSNWKTCYPQDPTSDITCAWGNIPALPQLQWSELYLQNNKPPPNKEDYNPQLTYSGAWTDPEGTLACFYKVGNLRFIQGNTGNNSDTYVIESAESSPSH